MPYPNNAPETFDQTIKVVITPNNSLVPSEELITILLSSREEYDWPRGTGSRTSQQKIISIKAECDETVTHLNVVSRLLRISTWAGNRATGRISAFTDEQKQYAVDQIISLNDNNKAFDAVNNLTKLPGIDLVMSTKIFRFFSKFGAALDRHSSYFFNSLQIEENDKNRFSTAFKREWSDGRHLNSRLAIYYTGGRTHNLTEYFKNYLSTIEQVSFYLNTNGYQYFCPASNVRKDWLAADVEMAAYYWWALNGPK